MTNRSKQNPVEAGGIENETHGPALTLIEAEHIAARGHVVALIQQQALPLRAGAHHPQSNGRDERLHRIFREEMPLDEAETFYQAQEVIAH